MTTNLRFQFFDDSLVKRNAFIASTLHVGIKWLTVNHQTTTVSGRGCDAEDYEIKHRRLVVSAVLTCTVLMETVLLWMMTMLGLFYKEEYQWPMAGRNLKRTKWVKMIEVFVLIMKVVPYIGLMFVGYFLAQYLRAGISCGGGN